MSPLDFSIKRFLLPPMHPEGRRFLLYALLLSVVAGSFFIWLLPLGLLLAYGVFLFFRDPERVPPVNPLAITSPADGIVCQVSQCSLPDQLAESPQKVWRVCVFMSVLDVHVNRMPTAGTIKKIVYIPGKFFNASLDKASEDNERMLYLMETPTGHKMAFVQIAGLVARRIVTFIKEGDTLAHAERVGLIRFGSRVDLYLPFGVEPGVVAGQIMVAGESVIAHLPSAREG